jgi:hypothetical protein
MREISSPLDGFASPFGPQRGFNPLRIFANDEPGVWFEANDANTLFTDVAGTTPVTTPGDAVALQLDKSQGLTLGPELVTNGAFDTDVSGWNDLSGWTGATFSSGTAVVSVTSFEGAGQALTGLTIGATYQIKATVVATTAPAARLYIGSALNPGSSPVLNQGFLPPGDYTFNFVATATSHGIGLSTSNGGSTSTWDNVSVKELPGNHRTQATTAARPLYALHPVGGVRNLLEYTEEFDNAVWIKGDLLAFGAGSVANTTATLDPLGGNTADYIQDDGDGANSPHRVLVANRTISDGTLSCWMKADDRDYGFLGAGDNTNGGGAIFDLRSGGIVAETNTAGNFVLSDVSVEDAGNGWVRCSITFSGASNLGTEIVAIGINNDATGDWNFPPQPRYISNTPAGIFIWGAQLELGSTATNYQRVGSFLDVSEEGKARRGRIWYNGTSHFMETGTITPGTDKAQVFAGVRKLSDAAGMVAELSLNWATQPGTLSLQTGTQTGSAGSLYYYSSARGNAAATVTQGGEWQTADVSPDTAVLTGTHDIAGDLSTIRRNGVAGLNGTADKGLGNFLAYPLYFGARAGTSLFFNGYEDTSIVRFGPNLDASVIGKVESYVASKTPEPTL